MYVDKNHRQTEGAVVLSKHLPISLLSVSGKLCKNNRITLNDLNENIRYFSSNHLNNIGQNKVNSLMEIEKITLLKVLKDAKGNISKASKILGIDRSTLYRKIEKYKIYK